MKIQNKKGFTLVEVLIVVAIIAVMIRGIFLTLSTGQNTWMTTDVQIQLQDNLRITMDRVSKELRESGSAAGVMKITINDAAGVNGSDIIKFSVPILCNAGTSIINANGDVAYWGAPLTWGCTDSTCMDADDDCNTADYSFIQYELDANKQLIRKVLNPGANVIRQDVFAQNISDFQASLSADQNVVTLMVTAFKTTNLKRQVTATKSMDVLLRNRG